MAAGSIPVRQFAEVLPEQGPVVYQRIETNPDMFGAAQGRALTAIGQSIASIGGALNARQEEYKKNLVMEKYSKAKDKLRDYLYNPEAGLYNRKGGQAMGAHGNFVKFSEDLMTEALDELPDQKSKDAFHRMWLNERDSLNDSVMRFEGSQADEYSKQTALGVIQSATDMAASNYNDPKVIAKSIDDVRRAIRVNNQGAPIEAVMGAEKTAVSSIYKQVILRAAVDDPGNANEIFKQVQSKMEAADITEISKALAPALKKAQVNNIFTGITGAGAAANTLVKVEKESGATNLLKAVKGAESDFDPNAESPKGASGVMQVMPTTAKDISVALGDGLMAGKTEEEIKALLKDEKIGTIYGAYYLQQQLKRYDGDLEASLIAYNAGPGNADKWIKAGRDYSVLPKREETEPYVQKVMTKFMELNGGTDAYGAIPSRQEVDAGGLPAPGIRMTKKDWQLSFYAPQDMMPPTEGGQFVDARSAVMMDRLGARVFEKFGVRLNINEKPDPNGVTAGRRRGTADPKDNPHVEKSQHLEGRAFDVQIQGLTDQQKAEVLREARLMGFTGIGFYEGGSGHLHLDTGTQRSWGAVPDWAAPVMAEKMPTRPTVAGGVSKRPVQVASMEPMVTERQVAVPDPKNPDGPSSIKNVNVVNQDAGDLETWLAQADMIDDEDVKASVKSKLTVEWNRRQAIEKRIKKQNETEGWKYVEQGGLDSIPPALRAKLDHTFVIEAMNYEEKMSKGEKIKTDWNKWYEFNRLTDDEIIDANLTRYRPYFDDEHMDKAIARQAALLRDRENPKKADKPKIDGLRTRTQIVDDTVKSLGMEKKTELIGKMDVQLDKDILAFNAAHNRDPNSVEIQEMVDRMLLRDKNTWFGQGKPLVETMGDPDATADFIAVETPDQIPDNDFEVVVKTYRDFNKRSPSPAEVVDTYNSALRAYMGGVVEIPDNIKDTFRQGLAKAKNRAVSDDELNEYYKRYLLKYLGQ